MNEFVWGKQPDPQLEEILKMHGPLIFDDLLREEEVYMVVSPNLR